MSLVQVDDLVARLGAHSMIGSEYNDSHCSLSLKNPEMAGSGSGLEHRRKEQVLGLELARRDALLVRIGEQPVHLVPRLGEAPLVEVGAVQGALLLPERAVSDGGHVDPLPFL